MKSYDVSLLKQIEVKAMSNAEWENKNSNIFTYVHRYICTSIC